MPRTTRSKKDKEDSDPVPRKATRKRKGDTAASAAGHEEGDSDSAKVGDGVKGKGKGKSMVKTTNQEPIFPDTTEVTKKESNILRCLDALQYGSKRDRTMYLKTVGNMYVEKSFKNLTAADYVGKFTRRITALAWHKKFPYSLASASKFGDIMFIAGVPNDVDCRMECPIKFETKIELEGGGAGCSVTAMHFDELQHNVLYRAGIDGIVARVDLAHGDRVQFYNTNDWNRWFCSMGVNFSTKVIAAGDNKGMVYKFTLDGTPEGSWRLHRNKVHQCEFSKKDPNLLVTASLDKYVKIWDIRFLKESPKASSIEALHSLSHSTPLNTATFSPVDGSRLLTGDQLDELRVYQGPLWKDYKVIKHWHKHFQHITPIKAEWHPINESIVVGRYPKKSISNPSANRQARAIEFFDSYTCELVDEIYPPLDEICSLNVFNPTGEYLATGMNSKLLLWKPGISFDVMTSTKQSDRAAKIPLSEATRNILRGRQRRNREYSPESSDDEDSNSTPKKKKARTETSTKSSTDAASKASKKRKK